MGGVIDPDYQGEVKVILHNLGPNHLAFEPREVLAKGPGNTSYVLKRDGGGGTLTLYTFVILGCLRVRECSKCLEFLVCMSQRLGIH